MKSPLYALLASVAVSCGLSPVAATPQQVQTPAPGCELGRNISPATVPGCLYQEHIIDQPDRDSASAVIAQVSALAAQYGTDTSVKGISNSGDLIRSLEHIQDYYSRGLFADSARFDRMLDHLRVTIQATVSTVLHDAASREWPTSTPYLSWKYYPANGHFFQPVQTVQAFGYPITNANAPTDSVVAVGDALWNYAIWKTYNGVALPFWEYEFANQSGGITLLGPWTSGMAQGSTLFLYADAYRRTHDARWLTRGHLILRSMMIPWDQGGVLLPDTTHGYWWEEFHPVVQIWNGGAQALIGVGYYAQQTGDTTAVRMFARGIDAIKYYTHFYDTGYWTLYSRTQGLNSRFYHGFHIQLMDELYAMTNDQWFKTIADKWRTYTPPPGFAPKAP